MQAWIEFMVKATPDQLIEYLYVDQVAFGNVKDTLKAADAYLESQFAGKEVADIFLYRLGQIGAEIVIPRTCGCAGEDSAKIADVCPVEAPDWVIEQDAKRSAQGRAR
jgi:hypothetical protein